ncbi:hypothetical protein Tco_1380093, partial [Tanacetum coccineum]
METRQETRMETRLETRLEVMKLQQRPMPLVKEEQTLILTLSRVTDIYKKTKTRQKPYKTEQEIGKSMENRNRRRI